MDFLTDKQRTELKTILLQKQQDLQKQLTSSVDAAGTVDLDQPIGRLSRMDAMQQQQMAKASRRIAEQRLLQIEAALARFAAGDYGICVECEEEIDLARLQARPESPFCVDCQGRREQS